MTISRIPNEKIIQASYINANKKRLLSSIPTALIKKKHWNFSIDIFIFANIKILGIIVDKSNDKKQQGEEFY